MSKAMIYSANTNTQTLANGDTINFGSPVRRFGNNLSISGGNVIAKGEGYYTGIVNVSFASTAGTAIIQAYKDGVAIPGAMARVTTEAATNYQVSFPVPIRQRCCVESTITVAISGVTPTVTNASIEVVKE